MKLRQGYRDTLAVSRSNEYLLVGRLRSTRLSKPSSDLYEPHQGVDDFVSLRLSQETDCRINESNFDKSESILAQTRALWSRLVSVAPH